jgi:hypothetical protein
MSLSEVLSYNTEHLVDAAAHWQGLADQREEVFAGVRNDALSLPWEGQAADALHERTGSDYNTAMDSAGNLRQAAMMAKDGASTLDQMHSRVLYTLEDAQADGFAPTEALAFVDTRPSANAAELAQRQAQAQAYTGQLQSQVATLYTHDTQVGSDLTGATAGEGKIQFTDYTTGDGKKIPSPPPQPPTVINAGPPDDPSKHHCGPAEIAKDTLIGVGGAAGIGSGLAGEVPTIGGSTALILGSAGALWDSFDKLSECE